MTSIRPGGNFARSFTAPGMSPVSSSATHLLLERLADARQLGDPAVAGQRDDRDGRLAHRLGRVAVGDHAVDDRAVELVQVAELVEGGGDLGVREVGHRSSRRLRGRAARSRLAHPPDLQRGREPRARSCARVRAARCRRRARPRRRRPRPTAPAPSPTALAARTRDASRCCTARARPGLGPPTWPASRTRCAPARATSSRWTPTSRTTRPTCARLLGAAPDGADLVLGSRYVPGGGVENWGLLRRGVSRGGCRYAQRVLGVARARPHRRLQVLPARGARGDRLDDGALAGLRVPGRADLPRAARAASACEEIPILFRDREAGDSKMSARIALEAVWLVPALRLARRRDGSRSPVQVNPRTCRSRGMKTEQLALVQGWADTRATLRRWNAAPASCWRRGRVGEPRRRRAAARRRPG